MKRETAAALLLLLLLAAAALNTRAVDRLVGALGEQLSLSEEAAARGDYAGAIAALDEGIERWQSRRIYTGIFLRHADLDAAYESLYAVKGLLAEENGAALGPAFEGLRHQLRHLAWMEHLSAGTVF